MLDVAEAHFARKGYEGAHLESIASEVGVRKTALYYYFESKSALYGAVLERMIAEFDHIVVAVLDRVDTDPVRRLEELVDGIDDLLTRRPSYSQILMRIFVDRIPVDDSILTPTMQRAIGRVMKFYKEGVASGSFRKLSARHFLLNVLGMMLFYYAGGESTAAMLDVEDLFSQDAIRWRRDQFREMLLRGVLPGS